MASAERRAMKTGDVLILNGTSSAGKSSIAAELQALADEPFLHSGIDHFLHRMPARVFGDPHWCDMAFDAGGRLERVTLGPLGRQFLCAAYSAVAAFARAGFAVIVDDVLYDRAVARCAAAVLWPFEPLVVGVRCRLDVALAREQARGDRTAGGAQTFFVSAHTYAEYDFEIDTSEISARAAAAAIHEARARPRNAMRRMRARLDSS